MKITKLPNGTYRVDGPQLTSAYAWTAGESVTILEKYMNTNQIDFDAKDPVPEAIEYFRTHPQARENFRTKRRDF